MVAQTSPGGSPASRKGRAWMDGFGISDPAHDSGSSGPTRSNIQERVPERVRADHGRVVGVRSDVVLIDQEAIRLRTRMAVDVRLQEV